MEPLRPYAIGERPGGYSRLRQKPRGLFGEPAWNSLAEYRRTAGVDSRLPPGMPSDVTRVDHARPQDSALPYEPMPSGRAKAAGLGDVARAIKAILPGSIRGKLPPAPYLAAGGPHAPRVGWKGTEPDLSSFRTILPGTKHLWSRAGWNKWRPNTIDNRLAHIEDIGVSVHPPDLANARNLLGQAQHVEANVPYGVGNHAARTQALTQAQQLRAQAAQAEQHMLNGQGPGAQPRMLTRQYDYRVPELLGLGTLGTGAYAAWQKLRRGLGGDVTPGPAPVPAPTPAAGPEPPDSNAGGLGDMVAGAGEALAGAGRHVAAHPWAYGAGAAGVGGLALWLHHLRKRREATRRQQLQDAFFSKSGAADGDALDRVAGECPAAAGVLAWCAIHDLSEGATRDMVIKAASVAPEMGEEFARLFGIAAGSSDGASGVTPPRVKRADDFAPKPQQPMAPRPIPGPTAGGGAPTPAAPRAIPAVPRATPAAAPAPRPARSSWGDWLGVIDNNPDSAARMPMPRPATTQQAMRMRQMAPGGVGASPADQALYRRLTGATPLTTEQAASRAAEKYPMLMGVGGLGAGLVGLGAAPAAAAATRIFPRAVQAYEAASAAAPATTSAATYLGVPTAAAGAVGAAATGYDRVVNEPRRQAEAAKPPSSPARQQWLQANEAELEADVAATRATPEEKAQALEQGRMQLRQRANRLPDEAIQDQLSGKGIAAMPTGFQGLDPEAIRPYGKPELAPQFLERSHTALATYAQRLRAQGKVVDPAAESQELMGAMHDAAMYRYAKSGGREDPKAIVARFAKNGGSINEVNEISQMPGNEQLGGLQGALQFFQDPETPGWQKAMVGIGIPVAILGLLSSAFGGQKLAGILMATLGLGAAAYGAHRGGLTGGALDSVFGANTPAPPARGAPAAQGAPAAATAGAAAAGGGGANLLQDPRTRQAWAEMSPASRSWTLKQYLANNPQHQGKMDQALWAWNSGIPWSQSAVGYGVRQALGAPDLTDDEIASAMDAYGRLKAQPQAGG